MVEESLYAFQVSTFAVSQRCQEPTFKGRTAWFPDWKMWGVVWEGREAWRGKECSTAGEMALWSQALAIFLQLGASLERVQVGQSVEPAATPLV